MMSNDKVQATFHDGAYPITDSHRDKVSTPCRDCGREYLNGERITLRVTDVSGERVAWEGCCDCWVLRTEPVNDKPAAAKYTLAEARKILASQECARNGHDWEVASAHFVPISMHCTNGCGAAYSVQARRR